MTRQEKGGPPLQETRPMRIESARDYASSKQAKPVKTGTPV